MEFFIKGDDVYFLVSPRPHDTGMVTMISQDLSVALHAERFWDCPFPVASVWASNFCRDSRRDSQRRCRFRGWTNACNARHASAFVWEAEVAGERRVGVALASAESIDDVQRHWHVARLT